MNLSNAIERLRDQCRLQHLQWNTEQAYVGWLVRFAGYMHPAVKTVSPLDRALVEAAA